MANLPNPFEKREFKIAQHDPETNFGRFEIEPLERGFGLTVGNSLRRTLLSSLPGASIYAVEIEGARHEFTALEGIEEDTTNIILNLKGLILKIDDDTNTDKRLEIDVVGPCVVTAADIKVPGLVEVINSDLEIAHVAEGGKLKMTMYARNGRGYVTSEENKVMHTSSTTGQIVGLIYTDSLYSPITKVTYDVVPTRVGTDAKFDKLELQITTNGSIAPQDALALAARILVEHLEQFVSISDITRNIRMEKEEEVKEENKYADFSIEELDLSVRSYNCLKRAGINSISELTLKSEDEMMKIRNLGKKSLKEVKEKLISMGTGFRDYQLN